MVQFALSESLAPNVRLVSAANGAAVVSLLPHRIRYRVDARRWLTPSFPSPASCRIRKFHSRCSNVNSDVQFNHVVADDEFFPSEGSSIQGDFLAPVVQHNTGILETPSFGLLVLSEEEKNALAATPAHPPGLYDVVVLSPVFYANVVTGNVVERLWEFTWPSTIALLFPNLLPVAVMGFFAKWAVLVGGLLLGNFLYYYPRVPAYISLNVIQAAAQVLSAMMIIHDHTVATTSSSSVVLGPWFVVLVLAGSIEKLCGVPLGIANGRDWVVQLAVTSKPIALAQANAVLSRIDMLAEVFPGFVAYSWRVNVWGSSFQVWSSDVPEIFLYFDDRFTASDVDKCLETIKLSWKEYIQQPVLPISIAYVLLFFNVVLGPTCLMTGFFYSERSESFDNWGFHWTLCSHGACGNIPCSQFCQATRHFKGCSFWIHIPGFIPSHGCYSLLEWISLPPESYHFLLGLNCEFFQPYVCSSLLGVKCLNGL
ncbi:unnamed protein product [Linum tenue]|uniref:Solute carrier family 40 member n=1 Tax=Linum tenue TaxID=586396 RepID=A0AAV0MIJ5_9ROSI|nr:unnamed protein product [Linum tenue]